VRFDGKQMLLRLAADIGEPVCIAVWRTYLLDIVQEHGADGVALVDAHHRDLFAVDNLAHHQFIKSIFKYSISNEIKLKLKQNKQRDNSTY
jgi:hypothetical protein